MGLLSVVLPAYNEERMIEKSFRVISGLLEKEKIEYEILYVDDGSADETWQNIKALSEQHKNIFGIRFSRNFGKEAAIIAGLTHAKGACCAVMDCDLQHPPETLVEMYRLWEEGYEVVEGVKRSRSKESVFHTLATGIFYKLISKAVKMDMTRASDFKLLDRKVVDAILQMKERNAFFRAFSYWVGFRSIQVAFDVREREEGKTKWSTLVLTKYAISNITSFSTAPMQMVTFLGCLTLLFAIIMTIDTFVVYFRGKAATGFTTVILLILFIGSIIMISLGIIGNYIAKIYEETKQRPRYIVSEEIGQKEDT